MQLVFETHSTSVDNERGIASGWLPGELSETGRTQAKELGQRRLSEHVDGVFTSDLRRAVETAELAFGATAVPVRREWRLRECNYGDCNGMSVTELEAERLAHIDLPFAGGESYTQVAERVSAFLSELVQEWPTDSTIVLIGHSATRCALEHLLGGAPLAEVVAGPNAWQPGWRYVLG